MFVFDFCLCMVLSYVCVGIDFVDVTREMVEVYVRTVLKCALILHTTEFDRPEVQRTCSVRLTGR